MTRFVALKFGGGDYWVWVNPDQVVSVKKDSINSIPHATDVRLTDGSGVVVFEPVESILEKLTKA
jgi:hypothetical protein